VLLISAGIGATPVLAMLHALAHEHSDREIWWLHGARDGRDHSFATEARTLLASLPNVRTHVYYSRPGPDDREGRDFDRAAPRADVTSSRLGQAPIAAFRPACASLIASWTPTRSRATRPRRKSVQSASVSASPALAHDDEQSPGSGFCL
jgi:hypothetical protein